MRKRPDQKTLEEKFINAAKATQDDLGVIKSDIPKKGANRLVWPILEDFKIEYEEGSSLRKPITLPLREFEWNTLEKHVARLGVSKAEWLRYSIFSTMEKERNFLENE